MSDIKTRIVEILKANEGTLSDGYEFYCGGADEVEKTLEGIAEEIERLLTQRPPDLATDSCPNCNARLTWCVECEKHITPSH